MCFPLVSVVLASRWTVELPHLLQYAFAENVNDNISKIVTITRRRFVQYFAQWMRHTFFFVYNWQYADNILL